jgi:hypothetical protein
MPHVHSFHLINANAKRIPETFCVKGTLERF